MIQEFLPGNTLEDYIANESNALKILRIFPVLAQKLHEIHSKGVVHHDIKLDNIIVDDTVDGEIRVHIINFGLARPIGHYMRLTAHRHQKWYAPEVCMEEGGPSIPENDVYSFGYFLGKILDLIKIDQISDYFIGIAIVAMDRRQENRPSLDQIRSEMEFFLDLLEMDL